MKSNILRKTICIICAVTSLTLQTTPILAEELTEETTVADEKAGDSGLREVSPVVRQKEMRAPVYTDEDLKRITKTADSYNAMIYGNEDWDDVGPAVDDKYGGLSVKDYNALVRMVFAEAGGEGEEGMLLVANVILNRMKSYKYPVTVSAVVSQTGQFQPYANGRYATVEPNEVAVRAVKRALNGENNAPGVLYFKSVHSNAVWANKTVAFRYKNHIFYY